MVNFGLSLIIPAFNEEKRLHTAFKEIKKLLKENIFPEVEIIFVNDGSTDDTEKIIKEFIKENKEINSKLINLEKNEGKGEAVKQGILQASEDFSLICDTDMSTPLLEIEKFIEEMSKGTKIIIGSRRLPNSNLIKKQPWHRQKMGNIYGLLASLFTGLYEIKDFGCGFKVFKNPEAKKIFNKLIIKGWIFDTEVLYLAKKNNIEIKQVGVIWKNNEESKVKIISGIFSSIKDLIKIKLKHR